MSGYRTVVYSTFFYWYLHPQLTMLVNSTLRSLQCCTYLFELHPFAVELTLYEP